MTRYQPMPQPARSITRLRDLGARTTGVAALGLALLAAVEARDIWLRTSGLGYALDAAVGAGLAILLAVAGARLLLAGAPPAEPRLPAPWERWTVHAQRRRRWTQRICGGGAACLISGGIVIMGEASRSAVGRQPPIAILGLFAAGVALIGVGAALALRRSR